MEVAGALAITAGLVQSLGSALQVIQQLIQRSSSKVFTEKFEKYGLHNLHDDLSMIQDSLQSEAEVKDQLHDHLSRTSQGLEELYEAISKASQMSKKFPGTWKRRVLWSELDAMKSTIDVAQNISTMIGNIFTTQTHGQPESLLDVHRDIKLSQSISRSSSYGIPPASNLADKLERAFKWLGAPFRQNLTHSKYSKERLPGTCEWFVQKTEFGYQSWKTEAPASGVESMFWCRGQPGLGKTMLCSKVIDDLMLEKTHSASPSVAYFYMGHGKAYSAIEVASELLFQLCSANNILPDRLLTKDASSTITLDDVLTDLKHAAQQISQPCVVVIDALDETNMMEPPEMQTHENSFLKLIKTIVRSTLKLFVTSRPPIEETKLIADSCRGCHELELDREKTTSDILVLAESSIDRLDVEGLVKGSDRLKQSFRKSISENALGKFHWAMPQIQLVLEETNASGVGAALRGLKPDTTEITDLILRSIDQQSEKRRRLAYQTLGFLTKYRTRISITTLAGFLGLLERVQEGDTHPGYFIDFEDSIPSQASIEDSCLGLVQVDPSSNIVTVSHFDIEETLARNWYEYFENTFGISDIVFALVCYISQPEFQDGPCRTGSGLSDRLQRYPLYKYASYHWGTFAQAALDKTAVHESEYKKLESSLYGFLTERKCLAASQQVATIAESDLHDFWTHGWPEHMDTELSTSTSSLQVAIRYSLASISKTILQRDEKEVDHSDSNGVTPLHEAAKVGSETLIKLLLPLNAALNAMDKDSRRPIDYALQEHDKNIVNLLEEQESDIEDNGDGSSLLAGAALYGNVDIVHQRLSDGGSSAQEVEEAIRNAASSGHTDALKVLLERTGYSSVRSLTKSKSEKQESALILAVKAGHLETIRMLLRYGADPNAENEFLTLRPLHYAIKQERTDIAQLLLDGGADINQVDALGRSPLFTATELSDPNIASFLLFNGIDMTFPASDSDTVLHYAVARKATHIMDLVLDQGMDVNEKRSGDGMTALMCAAKLSEYNICQRLITKHHANTMETDNGGNTALMWAATRDRKSILSLLILSGGDLMKVNNSGQRASQIAGKEHPLVAEWLRDQEKQSYPDDPALKPDEPYFNLFSVEGTVLRQTEHLRRTTWDTPSKKARSKRTKSSDTASRGDPEPETIPFAPRSKSSGRTDVRVNRDSLAGIGIGGGSGGDRVTPSTLSGELEIEDSSPTFEMRPGRRKES